MHENYKVLNLEHQKTTTGQSLYKAYRSLIQLRNSSRALKEGALKMKVVKLKTDYCYNCEFLAISREVPGETVSLFMSFSPVITLPVNLEKHMKLYNSTYVEIDAYRTAR